MFKCFSKSQSKATVIQELKGTLEFHNLKYRALIKEKDELIQEQERTIVSLQEKVNSTDRQTKESLLKERDELRQTSLSLQKQLSDETCENERHLQELRRKDAQIYILDGDKNEQEQLTMENITVLQESKLQSDENERLRTEVDEIGRELQEKESKSSDDEEENEEELTEEPAEKHISKDKHTTKTERLVEKLRAQQNLKQKLKKELEQRTNLVRSLVQTIRKTKTDIKSSMRSAAHDEDRQKLKCVYENLSESFKDMTEELRVSKLKKAAEKKKRDEQRVRNNKTKRSPHEQLVEKFREEKETWKYWKTSCLEDRDPRILWSDP
ncbi:hypothetical protein WMY93_033548 [Mugilogobius chulae]|uniref:Uncharacterized protein n=1 Tax=Mugilogobius chulae TaxID=88201 RepID=A0AAW0MMP1_9GOBI